MRKRLHRNLVLMVLIVFTTAFVRDQTSLAQKVEDAIRAAEPDWRCRFDHAVLEAPLTVPSEKRLLIGRWERRSKNGQPDFVDLWIFQVDSRTDAEKFLAPV